MRKSLLTLSAVSVLAVCALASCSSMDAEFKGNAAELGLEVSELEEKVLGDYDAIYQEAAKITDASKTDERYKAFAEAEYSLIYEEGIILPWQGRNGVSASVSKTVPHQAGKASYGLTSDKFKNVVKANAVTTQEVRKAVDEEFEKHKGESHDPVVEDGWTLLDGFYSNPVLEGSTYSYAGKSFTVEKNLKTTYTKEPDKAFLNYLTNSWTYNSYHYTNMVDGLVENDKYGNIVGALADKYKVIDNEDGTQTWKFHIRSGAKWVKNSDGAFVADVKADDFVASAEYVLDAANGSKTASIVFNFVDGAYDYYESTVEHAKDESKPVKDFAETVGIKAEGDDVIAYTLAEPTPYFASCLTYSPFLPVNRAFLEAEGSDFGKSENHLLVCGAFRITEHKSESYMLYTKNADYWDKDHVYVDTVRRQFIPGTMTSKEVRQLFEAGEIDSFTVNPKDEEGWAKYITGEDGTGTQKAPANPLCVASKSYADATYIGYFNFNRTFWEYTDSANIKSYNDKLATAKAMLNKNFRLGFLYGIDVLKELEIYNPTDPASYCMRGYTNKELCSYNGKDYTDYVNDVFNKKQGTTGVSLIGIDNGSDPVYNKDKAGTFFEKAKAELLEAGMSESDFPIKLDIIGAMDVETFAYEEALWKTLEESSKGLVKVSFNIPETDDQDTDWGSISMNYDFSFWSGWGPDYADPNTYLHTMCIGGDMVEQFGF